MEQLPKVLESKAKIRFQDCDPFNHLNNGSYLNYFMNHREDVIMENYDLDIFKMASKTGLSWVSSSNQIAYLKPALLMETIVLESQLIGFNDSELKVEMRMYNSNKTQLKAILWASFVHFNLLKQKREYHTEALIQLFTEVHSPVSITDFEGRLIQLKSDLIEN